jgi:hypothetical protein
MQNSIDIESSGLATNITDDDRIIAKVAWGIIPFLFLCYELAIGLLGSGVSTLAFALTNQATSQILLGLILLVAGGSFGLTVVPLQTAPFRGMDQAQIARGTSMLSVVRQLGVVIGTAAVAVPLGQMVGAAGFETAFMLAGLLIIIAVPIAALLPNGNRDQAEPEHTN